MQSSLTFTNLKNIGVGNTLGAALQNKINPQPLPPAKTSPTWQQTLSNVQSQPLPKATPLPSSYNLPATGVGDALKMGLSQAATESGTGVPYIPSGPMSVNNAVPTSSTNSGGTSQSDLSTGQVTPLQQANPVTPIAPPGTFTSLSSPIQSTQSSSYMTSLAGLGNTASNTTDPNNPQASTNYNNAQAAQGNLQGISNNQTPAVAAAEADYNKFAQSSPYMIAAQSNPNVAADVASGRSSLLGQTFAAELAAKQNAVSNALTGQGQQITAAGTAGSQALQGQQNQISAATNAGTLSKPEAGAAFFGSPESGGLVGSGNNLIDNAVGNAISQVMSGSTTSDALSTLSSLGAPAQQAFISAMKQLDPSWSITGSNATAQQNWQQIQGYQSEGSALSNGLSNLDNITQTAQNFLQKTQLNPSQYPTLNQGVNTYIGQLSNPADKQTLTSIVNDIQKFQSQILSANSGQTPTANTEAIMAINPANLNVSQLIPTLNNLAKLGNNQLSVVQQQIGQIKGGGSAPYAGTPTSVDTNLQSTPANNTTPTISQLGTGAAGGLMSAGTEGVAAVKGLAAWLAAL